MILKAKFLVNKKAIVFQGMGISESMQEIILLDENKSPKLDEIISVEYKDGKFYQIAE